MRCSPHEEVWIFDLAQLDETGENEPRGIPMSDTSIRVDQRGELLDHRQPGDG